MKRRVIIILAVLAFIAGVGGVCEAAGHVASRRYTESLEAVMEDFEAGDWEGAEDGASRLFARWEEECGLFQTWMRHTDTDAVTHALRALRASLSERDRLSVLLYYGECLENFSHLHHRDAFTLKNIL